MIAIKGNRQYTITEAEARSYQQQGFDIVDNGVIIEHGAGKTVAFEKFASLEKKYDELALKYAKLEKQIASKANEKASGK